MILPQTLTGILYYMLVRLYHDIIVQLSQMFISNFLLYNHEYSGYFINNFLIIFLILYEDFHKQTGKLSNLHGHQIHLHNIRLLISIDAMLFYLKINYLYCTFYWAFCGIQESLYPILDFISW